MKKINIRGIFVIWSFLFVLSCTNTVINNAPQTNNLKENHLTFIDTINNSNNYSEVIDGWLKVAIKQQEVINKIGKPDTKGEDEFWGATGTYVQIWNFITLGVMLEMESEIKNGDKIVRSITIINPCSLTTSKGVGIGNNINNVKDKYNKLIDVNNSDENNIVVGSVYGGTIFSFENGVVSKIFVGAAAE